MKTVDTSLSQSSDLVLIRAIGLLLFKSPLFQYSKNGAKTPSFHRVVNLCNVLRKLRTILVFFAMVLAFR